MEILELDQVKTSKQLRYMKELGMVEAERQAQWMIYRLPDPAHPLLVENLKCLQDCVGEEFCFQQDLQLRKNLIRRLGREASACSEALLSEQKACCRLT